MAPHPRKSFGPMPPCGPVHGSEQFFPAAATQRVASRTPDLSCAFLLQPADVGSARGVPGLDVFFHAGREAGLLS